MRLESTFRIPVPAEVVFDNFLDADTMRRSVPGCTTLDRTDPNTFRGELSNQVAHVKFNATFAADITSMRRPHEIRAILSGEDRRLGSTLRLDASLDVVEDGADSVVSYAMEVAMWGKLGRMGEAIFRRQTADVQQQFIDTFSQACLGELPPEASPAAAAQLSGTVSQAPFQQRTATLAKARANGSIAARAAPMIHSTHELIPVSGQVASEEHPADPQRSTGGSISPVAEATSRSDRGLSSDCLVAFCGGLGLGVGMAFGAGIGSVRRTALCRAAGTRPVDPDSRGPLTMAVMHAPRSLEEALTLLDASADSMVYAGGTAIQILAQQGILHADDLVDIASVPGLDTLEPHEGGLTVRPMVSIRAMETDSIVRRHSPLVSRTYSRVANPRVRNTASVGGNIAHGDYRLDPPAALLVTESSVELTSVRGVREVPAREFFVDFQRTAIEHGEMVTGITIPPTPAGAGWAYVKLSSQSANDWPAASVAAMCHPDGDRFRLRLGLGAVAPVPRFVDVDVTGLDESGAVEAGLTAVEPLIEPIPDVRGSAAYKRLLGLSATRDAISQAWQVAHE